jgi:peptidoglycan/LPS O-acetylase OafA/YrhL
LAVLAATLGSLHLGAPDLLIVSLFAALVLVAVSNSGAFAKLLNIGPLIWLGEISYSLYLLHGLVQFCASKGLGAVGIRHTAALSSGQSLALMMLMLAICVFGASATYWGVENVWRRQLRTLLSGVPKIKFARAVRSERA